MQNRSLLLVAALADVAPEVVLHSVMPIFTFMGANVLRQDDEYSAHVIEQTIQRVIPPLVRSLHQKSQALSTEVIGGVSELLVSFVTAYKHIPAHRRMRLFVKLTDTLGAGEFLFVIIAMLAERYIEIGQHGKAEGDIVPFCKGVAGAFNDEIRLFTVVEYLDIISDVLHDRPQGIPNFIFESFKDRSLEMRSLTAIKLLHMLAAIIDSEKLRTQINRRFREGDMDSERLRTYFSKALEKVLALGSRYTEGPIQPAIALVMDNLLNLLSTPEFVRVVDSLIRESQFQRSALATFRVRITSEYHSDSASRTAVLNLTPRLADILTSSTTSNELKGDALSCISAVTTKHGRREPGIIYNLTEAVIGSGGLRSEDDGLKVLSLVCLSDMAACLGGRIVPIVPKTIPFCLELLERHDGRKRTSALVQNAVFAFLEALVNTIPSFMTSYLQKMLKGTWSSAANIDEDDDEVD